MLGVSVWVLPERLNQGMKIHLECGQHQLLVRSP